MNLRLKVWWGRFRLWLLLLGGLGFGLVLGLLVLWSGPAAAGQTLKPRTPPTVGLPAPEIALVTLDGDAVSLADLRGKAVMVNFWATWCPPCAAEMPLLERASQQYAGQLTVVGVNSGETADTVRPFVQQYALSFPIWLDPQELVSDRYYANALPVTFFVDADGILRAQRIGQLDETLLAEYLKTILK